MTMTSFANFLEQNVGKSGVLNSTIYFQTWLNSMLKMDSINNITQSSDLRSDLNWLHSKAYDFKMYYSTESITFVCDHFINKWFGSDKNK